LRSPPTEDCGRGKQRRNDCVAIEHRGGVLEPCGQLEWTCAKFQAGIDSNSHKGHQLEQRFEGDREHQAFVMLRGVDSARAE
jgi:hypothetical protein